MPTISYFYGITIIMYPLGKEHNPPHIHAITPDYTASFSIKTGEVLQGKDFPAKAGKMVQEFIAEHRSELLDMWESGNYERLEPLR